MHCLHDRITTLYIIIYTTFGYISFRMLLIFCRYIDSTDKISFPISSHLVIAALWNIIITYIELEMFEYFVNIGIQIHVHTTHVMPNTHII